MSRSFLPFLVLALAGCAHKANFDQTRAAIDAAAPGGSSAQLAAKPLAFFDAAVRDAGFEPVGPQGDVQPGDIVLARNGALIADAASCYGGALGPPRVGAFALPHRSSVDNSKGEVAALDLKGDVISVKVAGSRTVQLQASAKAPRIARRPLASLQPTAACLELLGHAEGELLLITDVAFVDGISIEVLAGSTGEARAQLSLGDLAGAGLDTSQLEASEIGFLAEGPLVIGVKSVRLDTVRGALVTDAAAAQ